MNVWSALDAAVAKYQEQASELITLAAEGKHFRKPQFRPPCVWVLIPRASAPPPSHAAEGRHREEGEALT